MKLKFNIKNRLMMGELYPKQGNLITMTITKELMAKVNLTSKELSDIGFKARSDGEGYIWDNTKDKIKTITIEKVELDLLKSRIQELDKEKLITVDMIEIVKMIEDLKPKS